jgi:hypothetical protein
MEEKSIAYELLEEVKKTNKRLFIIAIVELVIIVSMAIGFLIYESQYEFSDESYQYVDDTDMNNSTINQELGE